MSSKKSKNQNNTGKARKRKSRKLPMLLIIVACAGVAIAGGLLYFNKYTTQADQKTAISASDLSGQSSGPTATPDNLQRLVGRWVRPDGGYVIEIRSVDAHGKLQAAYFNPRPINVSQARVTKAQEKPHIFIELRDVGYPGATYTLTYDAQNDVLVGLYFQPTAGQSFDVVFVRMQ